MHIQPISSLYTFVVLKQTKYEKTNPNDRGCGARNNVYLL